MDIQTLDFSPLYNSKTANIDSLYSKISKDLKDGETDGKLFQEILDSAMNNVTTTNDYLLDAEAAKISFALGENDSTHDLAIAMQKASTALQYTVAVRDKMLEAYNQIMQIQI